jgi:hypothetical protein
MSHGHTRIGSRGVCINCGDRETVLTDEHVVPLSLGGQHILVEASCRFHTISKARNAPQGSQRHTQAFSSLIQNLPVKLQPVRLSHVLQGRARS